MSETKVCGACGVEKPLAEFFKNSNKAFKDGYARVCKVCGYKASRKYAEENREKKREYNRAYYAKRYPNDPEHRAKIVARSKATYEAKKELFKVDPEAYEKFKAYHRERGRKHYEENREAILEKSRTPEKKAQQRAASLKKNYGLTVERWEKMVNRHQRGCWICGKDNAQGRGGTLVVDHCHDSGKVRGALCDFCNTILGVLGDTIPKIHESTARFVKYLEAAEKLDVNDL